MRDVDYSLTLEAFVEHYPGKDVLKVIVWFIVPTVIILICTIYKTNVTNSKSEPAKMLKYNTIPLSTHCL